VTAQGGQGGYIRGTALPRKPGRARRVST
jgi:hypothetical protein